MLAVSSGNRNVLCTLAIDGHEPFVTHGHHLPINGEFVCEVKVELAPAWLRKLAAKTWRASAWHMEYIRLVINVSEVEQTGELVLYGPEDVLKVEDEALHDALVLEINYLPFADKARYNFMAPAPDESEADNGATNS